MSDSKPNHVVIVGCGFTGTTAFYQLVQTSTVGKITILESNRGFGPGFPYQPTESAEYLINNTNDTMCLDPSNRRAFVEWLHEHPRYSVNLDEQAHMPRAVYGEFLSDVIARTNKLAADRHIEVNFIERECLDIEERPGGDVIVTWSDGSTDADMAILATGRCPDIDAFGLEQQASGRRYFPTHMPGSRLDGLPLDAEIHVLGASLSAYDVVNQLYSAATGCQFVADGTTRLRFVANGNQRRVVLCSRSGRLKKMQSRNPYPVKREHFSSSTFAAVDDRSVTLEQVFELMSKDATANGFVLDVAGLLSPYAGCHTPTEINHRAAHVLRDDIDNAAADTPDKNFVVDYLDQAQFDIWDFFAAKKLKAADERRYRSEFESALLTYAAPCPIPTAQKILALMEADQLRIVHGMNSIAAHPAGNTFEIGHAFGTELAGYVINATGVVDRNLRGPNQSTLITNLVRRGLMRPYSLGGEDSAGADIDMRTFRCAGARSIYAANMFLWGPGFFTSAAIIMATIIQRLLAAAFPGD